MPSPWGVKSINPLSIGHALQRSLPHIGLQDFTSHDLRHTAASLMGRLKVARFIISRCLNHVDKTVTGKYDTHEYIAEKQDALDLLGAHIEALLAAGEAEMSRFWIPEARPERQVRHG